METNTLALRCAWCDRENAVVVVGASHGICLAHLVHELVRIGGVHNKEVLFFAILGFMSENSHGK